MSNNESQTGPSYNHININQHQQQQAVAEQQAFIQFSGGSHIGQSNSPPKRARQSMMNSAALAKQTQPNLQLQCATIMMAPLDSSQTKQQNQYSNNSRIMNGKQAITQHLDSYSNQTQAKPIQLFHVHSQQNSLTIGSVVPNRIKKGYELTPTNLKDAINLSQQVQNQSQIETENVEQIAEPKLEENQLVTIDNTEKVEEEKAKDLIASEIIPPEAKGQLRKKMIIPPKKIVMGQSSNNQYKQSNQNQIIIISFNSNSQQNNQNQNNQRKNGQGNQQSNQNQPTSTDNQQVQQNLKQIVIQTIQEIVKVVIQRSEDMNVLRQVIDLKNKKFKAKYNDSSVFFNILSKEQQRISTDIFFLNKTINLRIEDKPLIKQLQKSVKKMLKPFKGLNFDDFLNGEIHLNEIMVSQGDTGTQEQMKESRKRHMRILQASLKEQLVDPHVVLSICVQFSRQALYNELKEFFQCAYEMIVVQQVQLPVNNQGLNGTNQQNEIQNFQNLKKMIAKAKCQVKVQIHSNKKLDKVLKVLQDQNTEVLKQITTYKEQYEQKQQESLKEETYESNMRRNQIKGRNASVLGITTKDLIQTTDQPKHSTSSVDPYNFLTGSSRYEDKFQRSQQINLRENGCRSGNQTMTNFFNTPQINSGKADSSLLSTSRILNPQIINYNNKNKQLAPLTNNNLSLTGTTKGTENNSENQIQQAHNSSVYLENLDIKNFKRLNQLPSMQHHLIQSQQNTPVGSQQQAMSQRGNSAENLLKLLYQNKTKKLLEPLPCQIINKKQATFNKEIKLQKPISENIIEQRRSSVQQVQQVLKEQASPDKQVRSSKFRNSKHLQNFVSFSTHQLPADSDPNETQASQRTVNSSNIKIMIANKQRVIKTTQPMATRQNRKHPSKINIDSDQSNLHTLKITKINSQKLDQEPKTPIQIKINEQLESVFSRYFNKKEIIQFIHNNRARRIQAQVRKQYSKKLKSKSLILKYYKIFRRKLQEENILVSKIQTIQHKKAAKIIEKHYKNYKLRWHFSQFKPQLTLNQYGLFTKQILHIQRAFRTFHFNKTYKTSKLQYKNNHQKKMIFNDIRKRYHTTALLESKHLQNETLFTQEQDYLSEYVKEQQESQMEAVKEYENSLIRTVENNFEQKDWSFNNQTREWQNNKINLSLKHIYNQQMQAYQTPLQMITEYNKKIILPKPKDIEEVNESLTLLQDCIGNLLNKERRQIKLQQLQLIKNQRIRHYLA